MSTSIICPSFTPPRCIHTRAAILSISGHGDISASSCYLSPNKLVDRHQILRLQNHIDTLVHVPVMFKKKPQIKPLAPIRSSDRRKTADNIISTYGLQIPVKDDASAEEKATATTEHTNLRNSLLPDNIQSARFTTTHGPDLKQVSGTVYVGNHPGEDQRVLWFKIEEQMYPSGGCPARSVILYTTDNHESTLYGGTLDSSLSCTHRASSFRRFKAEQIS